MEPFPYAARNWGSQQVMLYNIIVLVGKNRDSKRKSSSALVIIRAKGFKRLTSLRSPTSVTAEIEVLRHVTTHF